MNVLDLCAGYGGFSLALKLLGDSFRTICYVERDSFCQALLMARMEELRELFNRIKGRP